jgi:hypothetical protein
MRYIVLTEIEVIAKSAAEAESKVLTGELKQFVGVQVVKIGLRQS